MPSSSVQSLGERITYAWHDDSLTVIINQRIPKAQLFMLQAWLLAWLGVGAATALEMGKSTGSDRTFFLIFMAFWAFFAFRVLKVILWRRVGREMIRVSAEGMSVKNAFGDWGRARFFLKDNILKMEVMRRDPSKFMQNLDQSFWIMGGDSLQFSYMRGRFVLGKQLDAQSAGALAKLIDKALKKF
jgi:hypothetical protein